MGKQRATRLPIHTPSTTTTGSCSTKTTSIRTSSTKSATEPIPLPHDGPIHYYYYYYYAMIPSHCPETASFKALLDDVRDVDRAVEEQGQWFHFHDPILIGSLQMLQYGANTGSTITTATTTSSSSTTENEMSNDERVLQVLLQTLIQPATTHIHSQLQALQQFRNWKIQQRNKSDDDHNQNYDNTVTQSCSLSTSTEQYLYRILLEWMISYATPVSLRRAIYSCLSVMLPSNDDDTIVRHSIWDRIFDSILLLPVVSPPHTGDTTGGVWNNPLYTLNEFVSWEAIEEWVQMTDTTKLERMLHFIASNIDNDIYSSSLISTSLDVEQLTLLANITNKCLVMMITMMNDSSHNKVNASSAQNVNRHHGNDSTIEAVQQLQQYLWNVIRVDHSMIPMDRLSNIGIAYGRTVQYQMIHSTTIHSNDTADIPSESVVLISTIMEHTATLPLALQRIPILQGIAVIVPLQDDLTFLDDLVGACKMILDKECDPDVRCFALKGLRTLMSRINTLLTNHPELPQLDRSIDDTVLPSEQKSTATISFNVDVIRRVTDDVLQIVLQAWENPSTRKLANAIPALFDSVIQVMMKISIDHSLDTLVDRILAQPPNLKGRYLALEIIMPITGVTRFVQPQTETSTSTLLDDLLHGIGDCGHNTGVMADLWAKLLRQLRIELQDQSKTAPKDHGIVDEASWLNYWVPSLSNALVSSDLTRRKQTASFCLPRIVSMEIRASAPRIAAVPLFVAILTSIEAISENTSARYYKSAYVSQETHSDRVILAVLEVIRHAASEGLLKPTLDSTTYLREKVATLVPEHRLRSMLTHSSMTIRIAAFKAIESIVSSYGGTATSFECICSEAALWKYALPFSIKTDGKEFTLSLLQCLLLFLDRLSLSEASSIQCTEIREATGCAMSVFQDFVVEFLLFDVALKKTGYPGTIALKESFLFQLLECVIVFCSRRHPLATDSKLLPKSAAVFRRRRHDHEEQAITEAKKALLSQQVFECCVSSLHSSWDDTRNNAYRIIMSLVQLAELDAIEMPSIFTKIDSPKGFLRRGVLLASSPRQREADTGAKLLAFLFVALRSEVEKVELLEKLLDLLDRRLMCIKQKLTVILFCNDPNQHDQLPLAHGIIHAIRLIIESDDNILNRADVVSRPVHDKIETITSLFFDAIRISLAVVADVKEGEIIDGMDEDLVSDLATNRRGPTRMVNPSAIGANGIFSSVNRLSDAETAKRLASQRIIVGSWLLTKETCGALATVLSKNRFNVPPLAYDETGRLLISTLTSLKHTGAAFAAHRALQTIAQSCFTASHDRMLYIYPEMWTTRIIDEISTVDKIRDSTLRRSTGYSLGVLALMRAEGISNSHHSFCRSLMIKIVSLCLPSRSQSDFLTNKIHLTEDLKRSIYSIPAGEELTLNERPNNVRTRVHALNILRSILLDAPLARDVYPFVGVALVASVIGYMDSEWSVRNSSTMVFAAAMLRSIDSDKNATNKDTTGRNPVTAYELFRSYPSLGPFLLALLKGGVQGIFSDHQTLSLPPILPILLILSRLNPVSMSGRDSMIQAEPFISPLLQLLSHKELIIRKNASNALRNLVSLDIDSASSVYVVLLHCQENLISMINNGASGDQWNHVHGILLSIRELVRTFPEANAWLTSNGTVRYITAMTRLYVGLPIIPPSCLSVSIEICSNLIQAHDIDCLYDICKAIISWLSNDQQSLYCVGTSELAALVASIMVNIDCTIIWDNMASLQKKEVCLHQLSLLIQSDCIDIRIAATKTFKKTMSNKLAIFKISEVSQHSVEMLLSVLLSSLERELLRDSRYTYPHTPTLRRLSRCIVTILRQSVVSADIIFPQNLCLKSTRLAQHILNVVTDFSDPDIFTILHGNALEMTCKEWENASRTSNQRYLLLTNEFSTPTCDWRLRLSAANTLLKVSNESEAALVTFVNFNFLKSWIVLVQDEDVDVRSAALSASHGLYDAKPSDDVTELAFMHGMHRLVVSDNQELIHGLLCIFFQLSENAFHDIDLAIDKHLQSNRVDPFATILHEGTARLIFESDTPNAYFEKCFACQLLAVSILQMHFQSPTILAAGPVLDAANDFLTCTKRMLSRLLECIFADSYDVTHSIATFPLLHNQIIGTLTLICMFGHENLMVQEIQLISSMIVNGMTVASKTVFHPFVSEALVALVFDKSQYMSLTMTSLYKCCFLLPQTAWNDNM